MMKITTRAPGKLILIGEYAVLEGAPALVMAIDRYAKIRISDSPVRGFILHSAIVSPADIRFEFDSQGRIRFLTELSKDDHQKLALFCGVLEKFFESGQLSQISQPLEITLDTSDFFLKNTHEKLGLGSSAALSVALVAGLETVLERKDNREINPEALFELAQSIHHTVQGKIGSGIDIAASSYGGIIEFRHLSTRKIKPVEILRHSLPEDLIILPVWSGASASTPLLVKQVQNFKQNYNTVYEQVITNLHNIASRGCRAFAASDSTAFIQSVSEYFEGLNELEEKTSAGIISDVHRKIAQIVHDSGAVYKPSGAGGGDLGIALTRSRTVANHVSGNILRSGFHLINLVPSPGGAYVEIEGKE
jgi:phosphomevalonate kinase